MSGNADPYAATMREEREKLAANPADEGLESAYGRLREAKNKATTLNQKAKALEDRIAKLKETHSKMIKMRDLVAVEKLRSAAAAYSLAWMSGFVAKLRSRLPREIRDMVFESYWAQNPYDLSTSRHESGIMYRSRIPGFVCFASYVDEPWQGPCECLRRKPVPGLVDPAYVGREMALEAVEALYRTQRWDKQPIELDEIDHHLHYDEFHIGFRPSTVVRTTNLLIRPVEHTDVTYSDTPSLTLDPDDIVRPLNLLLRIPNKRNYELRIKISQCRIYLSILAQVIETIKPVLSEFIKAGAHVKIDHCYEGNTLDEDWRPELRDISASLNLPPDEWKKEMIKYLDDVPFILERHRVYQYEDTDDFDVEEEYRLNQNGSDEDDEEYDEEDDEDDYEGDSDAYDSDDGVDGFNESFNAFIGGFGPRGIIYSAISDRLAFPFSDVD